MVNTDEIADKTDNELVALTLENQDYFAYIISRYEGKLLRYIMRISNFSYEEAEDALQDIYLKVYRNLNDFDQSLKFSSWIYRITHNQVISNFRKKSSRPEGMRLEMDENQFNNLSSDLNIGENIDYQIDKTFLEKAMLELDEKYREVLVLYFFEERNYAEISDILKKSMGTVATLLSRAKLKLRYQMEEIDYKL
jgi:RNA polymerase sigma-70 factor (ECF subfamily)